MATKSFSIRDSLSTGWDNLENNFKIFAGAMAIITGVGLVSFFLNIGSSVLNTFNNQLPLGLNIILSLVTFIALFGLNIISMMLYYGVKKIAIKVYNSHEVEISDIFLNYKIILRLLLFHLILVIGGLLSFLIVGGFVALLATVLGVAFKRPILIALLIIVVLSLLIYIFMRLFFITYFIIDKNIKLVQAVKYSLKITDGVAGKLFLLNLILVIINFIGLIFGLVLGSIFVTQPLGISTMAKVYHELMQQSDISSLKLAANEEASTNRPIKKGKAALKESFHSEDNMRIDKTEKDKQEKQEMTGSKLEASKQVEISTNDDQESDAETN